MSEVALVLLFHIFISTIIYQAKIFSKSKDEYYEFYDYPDIVLEISNGRRIIIHAKNSKYEYNNPNQILIK